MNDSRTFGFDAQIYIKPPTTAAIKVPWNDDDLRKDLYSITTSNHLRQPFGRLSITLAAREVVPGKTWEDLIEPYSLVIILLHRIGPTTDPLSTSTPEAVIVGIIDRIAETDDFSDKAPRRSIRLMGRSLTGILSDQKWWYHGYLNFQNEDGTQKRLPANLSDYMLNPPTQDQAKRELTLRGLGVLGIDTLLDGQVEFHPAQLMLAIYEFFVGSATGTQEEVDTLQAQGKLTGAALDAVVQGKLGFIKTQFVDAQPLETRLRFDPQRAVGSFFDPLAKITFANLPQWASQGQEESPSCWDLLRYCCDDPFVELFSETFGTGPDDAYVAIIMRKPPWVGYVNVEGKIPGDSPRAGVSLFDRGHPGTWWERESAPLELRPEDILGRPEVSRGAEGGSIYTAYEVEPTGFAGAGKSVGQLNWIDVIPPIFEEDETSPSFIGRYGIRPMKKATKYLPSAILPTPDAAVDPLSRSVAYEVLLRQWYCQSPNFRAGSYRVRGSTVWRVGRRLIDVGNPAIGRPPREFYIIGVTHQATFTGKRPQWLTTLQVERGWDLGDVPAFIPAMQQQPAAASVVHPIEPPVPVPAPTAPGPAPSPPPPPQPSFKAPDAASIPDTIQDKPRSTEYVSSEAAHEAAFQRSSSNQAAFDQAKSTDQARSVRDGILNDPQSSERDRATAQGKFNAWVAENPGK